MRQKFFILIIAAFICSFATTRQPIHQVTITSFSVKKKMPADISSWVVSYALTLSAQKNPQSNVGDVKFTVQIRQDDLKICGNNVQNATLTDLKPLRSFSSRAIVANLSSCGRLSTGSYRICIQFFNADNYPVSNEVCRDFIVEGTPETVPKNIANDRNPANKRSGLLPAM